MNGPHEYREFLKSDIWRSSDVIHDKTGEKGTFERVVISTFDHLDLSDLSNRKELFVQAYDHMVSQGVEERDIALLLTLFERSLNLLDVIEAKRSELLEFLNEQKQEEEAAEPEDYDAEVVAQLEHEVNALSGGSFSLVLPLLEEYSSNDLNTARASKSSFAGPYVRTVLDSKKGNRKYTENLRGRLAKMFHTSPQTIASMKAWNSGELNERGSTIQALIDGMRPKVRKAVSISECPEWAYSLIGDPNLVAVARSLEPPTFEMDSNSISREQRRWIYALFIFGPNDNKKKTWLRKTLASEIFHCSINKVGAVTAYLAGKHFESGRENGGDRWEDVMEVMRLGGFLDEEEQVDEKNDDGTNEADLESDEIELAEDSDEDDNKDSGEPASVQSGPRAGGEHFEYDNEAKIEWRKRLKSFIDENTDPEKRKGMRVLCLPGKECLEIGVYTDLGFELSNIIAVEGGDSDARVTFEKNAKALGVRYGIGRLEDGVVEHDEPFNVVSLDFLGSMCPTYIRALNSIPYSKNTLLCVNTMAKRDSLGVAYGLLQEELEDSDVMDTRAIMRDFFENLLQEDGPITPNKVGEAMINTPYGSELKRQMVNVFTLHKRRRPVAKTREMGLIEIYARCFANQRPSPYAGMAEGLFPSPRPLETRDEFTTLLGEIFQEKMQAQIRNLSIGNAVEMLVASFPDLGEDAREYIQSFVRRALLNRPRITRWGRYPYQSGSSPFVSHFMRLESPDELVARNHAAADFLIYGASSVVNGAPKNGKASQRDSDKLAALRRFSKNGKLRNLDRRAATFLMRQLGVNPNKKGPVEFRIGPHIVNINRHGIEVGLSGRLGEYRVTRGDVEKAINETRAFESDDMWPKLMEMFETQALNVSDTGVEKASQKKANKVSGVFKTILEKAAANDSDALKEFNEIVLVLFDALFSDDVLNEMLGRPKDEMSQMSESIMSKLAKKLFPDEESDLHRAFFIEMLKGEKK